VGGQVVVIDMSRSKKVPTYICPEDFNKFYAAVSPTLKSLVCGTQDELQLLQSYNVPIFVRLSRGNRRPPHDLSQLWVRLAGLLRRLIENPCGVKAICKMYKRKDRGTDLRPPRIFGANGAFVRRSLRMLADKDLVRAIPAGYHTTQRGKELLKSAL